MGVVTIKFDNSWYQQLKENALPAFRSLLSDNEAITTQLQNYHSDEGGAPIVPSYEIISADLKATNNSGQIRFAYHVEFTFACADRRAETRHTETSNFTIDLTEHRLTIHIHDKISRDTYEEF